MDSRRLTRSHAAALAAAHRGGSSNGARTRGASGVFSPTSAHELTEAAHLPPVLCRAQLVELKNGETYNGELVTCDNWMNIALRGVICTSRDGDRFWKLPEVVIRGNNVKYLRIPEEVIGMVPEEDPAARGKGGGKGDGRGRGGKGGGKGDGKGKGKGGRGGDGRGGGRASGRGQAH